MDLSTAAIAIWYLSMRARYGQLLTSPATFEDHTRLAAETQSRHDATHDHLTALPNRQALFDALDQALDPTTGDEACALLFIDLDGFKDVNDRFGHVAGDELLVAAAGRLRSAIRPSDMLARIGGDEFVILLAGATTEEEATAVAMRQTASLVAPFGIAQDSVSLTVSTGIAIGAPGALNAAELLHRADSAMYQAKQAGPGRYRIHLADSPLATA